MRRRVRRSYHHVWTMSCTFWHSSGKLSLLLSLQLVNIIVKHCFWTLYNYLAQSNQMKTFFFKCSFQEIITVRGIHVSSYSDYLHWNPFVPVIFSQNLCTTIAFFKTLQVFNFRIVHSLLRGSDQYRLVSRYDL